MDSEITNTPSYRSINHNLVIHDIGRDYCELRKNNRMQKMYICYSISSQINLLDKISVMLKKIKK